MDNSKAAVLQVLSERLNSAIILPLFRLNAAQWQASPMSIVDLFWRKYEWAESPLIVRSNSSQEDSEHQSFAGHFCSVLDICGKEALIEAINTVVESLQPLSADDEVFIQPMLKDVVTSGVVFTTEPSTGAPYYVINSDNSGSTESVTSGETNDVQTTYIVKSGETLFAKSMPQWQKSLLTLCQELEEIFDNGALDIEFAVDGQMQLYLFQVRPLVITDVALGNVSEQQALLTPIASSIERLSQPHPYLFGKKSIFGVMPDWNPAEIIGIRPRPLALSLYKELVTDATWAYQRDNYGYQKLRSFPLLVNFHGLPYIDVRVSFNSFIPAQTDGMLAEKLVNYYIEQLEQSPEKHDKVEFDIIYSCYTLDIDDRLKVLAEHGFNDGEIGSFKLALRQLTNEIIHPDGLWQKDIEKIGLLPAKRQQIIDSELPTLDKIYWLLEDCKRYGTLPFAGLARAGFIAVQLLKSLVTVGVLSDEDYHAFMGSLDTVSSQMADDHNELSNSAFLKKYGHLRPGTYDILSPRYDLSPEKYFSPHEQKLPDENPQPGAVTDKFALTLDQLEQLESLLSKHGLTHDVISLFRFIRGAIEGREYAKFIFTRSLSDAIELMAELGQEHGFDREQISFMDCSLVHQLYSDASDRYQAISDSIRKGQTQYRNASKLILPPLICRTEDIFYFEQPDCDPNFITLQAVDAPLCAAQLSPETVEGKIVFIPSADPGFDWLFANNIAGLVTQFGGVNSHMAIRAGELGIPAVIGAGQLNYERWSKAEYLRLDTANKQVVVIR